MKVQVLSSAPADADIEITVPYIEPYGKLFAQNESVFNHVGAPVKYENLQDGTDLKAVYEGKVAVTPIDLRLATKEAVSFLQENLLPRWKK